MNFHDLRLKWHFEKLDKYKPLAVFTNIFILLLRVLINRLIPINIVEHNIMLLYSNKGLKMQAKCH